MPDPRSFLPLPAHDFQVLLTLTSGPRHAYGLASAVESGIEGEVRLEIGSLYRMLARMTTAGLIEMFDPPAGADGHEARRRYYRITPLGRSVAAAEAARLERAVRAARKLKLLPQRGSR